MFRRSLAFFCLGLGLVLAGPAAAHVEVLPAEAEVDRAQEFTVRVPVERDVPTTRVLIDFPSQISVYSLRPPPPGFTMRIVRFPDGRIRGVDYRGRIPVSGYQSFQFLATPIEAGTARWRAQQTYADGAVKPWTAAGEPNDPITESGPTAPGPAATTEVVATGAPTGAPVPVADGGGGSDAGLWLGLIAIAIAALAALAAGLVWATRPLTLPPDEDD